VYVSEVVSRQSINTEWMRMFPSEDSRPARHLLRQDLPGGMVVQCEALAYNRACSAVTDE
jgi:hypothetical protein